MKTPPPIENNNKKSLLRSFPEKQGNLLRWGTKRHPTLVTIGLLPFFGGVFTVGIFSLQLKLHRISSAADNGEL